VVSPSAVVKSVAASVLAPPLKRSAPGPPVSRSLPPPPPRLSASGPPESRSLPAAPPRLSSPPPLDRVSSPLPPHSRSLPASASERVVAVLAEEQVGGRAAGQRLKPPAMAPARLQGDGNAPRAPAS
jgi:hypothetical protein